MCDDDRELNSDNNYDIGKTKGEFVRTLLSSLGCVASKIRARKVGNDSEPSYCERGFEIADFMESGHAREMCVDFMRPLKRSSRLWRFRVVRSEDQLQHQLISEGGEFLMHATTSLEARRVCFFTYSGKSRLFDRSRPAFVMDFDETGREWRLVRERCESCEFASPYLSCRAHGSQQVAFIRHSRRAVGDGVSNNMEIRIPGIYSDGSCVVWCPKRAGNDLARVADDSYETQNLVSRLPAWNDTVQCLVLDFKGRHVLPSSRNFQVALRQKREHVICQYGKLGKTNFSLDVRFPMSVIQAFAASLTTIFWT